MLLAQAASWLPGWRRWQCPCPCPQHARDTKEAPRRAAGVPGERGVSSGVQELDLLHLRRALEGKLIKAISVVMGKIN